MIEAKHVLLSLLIKKYLKIDTRTEVLLRFYVPQRQLCAGNDSFGDFLLNAWSNTDICDLYLNWMITTQLIRYTPEQTRSVSTEFTIQTLIIKCEFSPELHHSVGEVITT